MNNHHGLASLWLRTIAGWTLAVAALFLANLALTTPAHAAGVVGNGTPGSCTQGALDVALGGGGTVTFNCGGPATVVILSEMTITQDTVIEGGEAITLTAGLTSRIFRVAAGASLALADITLDSAFSPAGDGGAVLSSGTLALDNVAIQNSQTGPAFCGGAIRSDGSTVITNSRFSKNSAGLGGAICIGTAGAPTLSIAGSTFNGNQATRPAPEAGLGGAIFLNPAATLEAVGNTFLLNKADAGGALAISSGVTATLAAQGEQKMVFLGNSATQVGGAIYNLGDLHVGGAEFNGNTVPENTVGVGYGGGIASMGRLTLQDSFFSVNRGRFGGGMFVGGSVDNARADVRNAIFSQNTAAVFGGGLYTNNETTVITVTNSVFRRNSADTGGGLARFNADLQLADSSLTENSAVSAGGGMYLAAGPSIGSSNYVKVRSVTISSNQAASGQGGGVYNAGRAELYFTSIVSNTNGVYTAMDGNTRLRSAVVYNPGSANCTSGLNTQVSNDAGNHVSDATCGADFPAAGDPQLGPLQSDGLYATAYHLPLAGSPLINLGYTPCPERDQRGALRPDACDTGAVEFGGQVEPPPPAGSDLYLPIITR